MPHVFILKDPMYNESESKTHNFSLEWNKWYGHAKIAPKDYQFNQTDIIIVNINDADDPYKGYSLNPSCKQIHIVHKINKKNIGILRRASYAIYINPIIAQIALLAGVDIPHTICPRYPLYEFFGTSVVAEPYMHIGGWFRADRTLDLLDALVEADKKVPSHIGFHYDMVSGGLISRRNNITEFVNKIKSDNVLPNRIHKYTGETHPIAMSRFIARTASYGFIHRTTPSFETISSLIQAKDLSVLEYDITESSMLSLYQSAGIEVIANDCVDVFPLFNQVELFTFKDFASLMSDIIKKYS